MRRSASVAPSITRVDLCQRDTGRLGDERHGAARTRVRLDHVDRRPHHGVLDVDQTGERRAVWRSPSCRTRSPRRPKSAASAAGSHRRSRRSARRLPRRAPSHRRSGPRRCGRGSSTSTSVASARKRSIRDRPFGRQPTFLAEAAETGEFLHRPSEVVAVVDDLHRPAAEDVARSHQHREADVVGDRQPCSRSIAVPPGGCGIRSSSQIVFQRSRSSAASIESGDVPATSSRGSGPTASAASARRATR